MASYTIKYGDTLSGIASMSGKSIQELMRLNPSIADPNKIQAGNTLNIGESAPVASAPAPKPTAAVPQKQTIAQVAKVSIPTYVEDSTATQIGQNYKSQATQSINEEAIRAATRARIQGQIDAINAAVTDQIARFRSTTAKNRTGQSYALAAAGGTPVNKRKRENEQQEKRNVHSLQHFRVSFIYLQFLLI
jgi:LysM repeat protein